MKSNSIFLFCLLFDMLSCQESKKDAEEVKCHPDPEVTASIAATWKFHVDAHLKSDPVLAASIYDDNVWWLWEGGLNLRGRNSSEGLYREWYKTFKIIGMGYTSEEVLVCADGAHEAGNFYMITDADGKIDTAYEHYMVLWKKQEDGVWKVYRGAGSSLPKK